jgi:hypothetical protein
LSTIIEENGRNSMIETEPAIHVNHPVLSPTGSATEDRTPLKEVE